MSQYDAVLEVAMAAAEAATQVHRKYYGRATSKQKTASQDFVTQADVEAEEAILELILRAFPDHAVMREEGASTGEADAEHLWIIDPLDGTTNYAHSIPQFSTAIGYAAQGQVQVGVVHDPMRNEVFHAVRDCGAFLNGSPIKVSERTSLQESVISTGFYYDRGEMMRRTLRAIEDLFTQNIHGIRRFGGAALDQCWVACGRFEGFFEYQLSPWDFAAASLIVEEANGRISDRKGLPLTLTSLSVIAGNPHIFPALSDVVRWIE